MATPSSEPRLVQVLSSHWCVSPLASDTADGIQRWWLPISHGFTLQEVRAALAWMVSRGLVEENSTADGRVRYRRNPRASQLEFERLAPGADGDSAET